ncbi:MAG: hypothetical protein KDB03_19350 [Planctomycetales bacterium]|nr:hypothetical protein [Planctomycetales bacterium]
MKKFILMATVAITLIASLTESSFAIGLLLPAIQKIRDGESSSPYTVTFSDLLVSSYQSGGSAHSLITDPVLMVISNQDFWYQGYTDTRCSFECTEIEYVVDGRDETLFVAGTYVEESYGHRPQRVSFYGALFLNPKDPNELIFEYRFQDSPKEPHSIVFVGGWGSSMYQYAFEGTY